MYGPLPAAEELKPDPAGPDVGPAERHVGKAGLLDAVYLLTIGLGLVVDRVGHHWVVSGEHLGVFICWALFGAIFYRADRTERLVMFTLVGVVTPAELALTEGLGFYEYLRGSTHRLMPLFVPPGHWFLFDLGRRLSRSLTLRAAWLLCLPFLPASLYFAALGRDTSGLLLITLLGVFLRWGPQPRLYATMTWIALAMELWGTHLGNWEWHHHLGLLRQTPLTASNPPLLCGAGYAFIDLIVNMSVDFFTRSRRSTAPNPLRGPSECGTC